MLTFDEERILALLSKAQSYFGMIAEIKSKALLIKKRFHKAKADKSITKSFMDEVAFSAEQMKKDMAKYTRRINRIYEEFERYGLFLKLDGMDGS